MTTIRLLASLLMCVAVFQLCDRCATAQAQPSAPAKSSMASAGNPAWAKAKLEQSPRHREYVTVKNGARKLQAFVVYPEVKNKAPVVIVIHEIFGLTDWVKTVADELAANGYIAIAPDLLDGKVGEDATKAVGSLPPDQITGDLNTVADYAKKIPAANGKLAVSGFCWGGGQSFRFATNRKDLSAAFVFYGSPPDDAAMKNITAPVYGFYAENDARITSTVPGAKEKMKAAGKKYEPVIYKDIGHGFMRTGAAPDAKPADKKAHDEAWARWLKELKGL
ncbi:MAG: dienelactone hydrolase family protein [Terriglobales bacterium]